MLITSSRKPSINTRYLCKALALFFQCDYFNRGKMGMKEALSQIQDEYLMIVTEYHGNPGSLNFYDIHQEVLSIRISILFFNKSMNTFPFNQVPTIKGDANITSFLAKILGLDMHLPNLSLKTLNVTDNYLEFLYDNNLFLKLNIKSIR